MNVKECCALLDKKNPYTKFLVQIFEHFNESNHLIFELKGTDLVEVVQQLKDRQFCPTVDKKLKLVFGTRDVGHDFFLSELFQYHYCEGDPEGKRPHIDMYTAAGLYTFDGMGYFISAVRPEIIIMGRKYRPDNFDYALFAVHQTRFNDE